ncbi:isoprenyl transferase [uncultured Clostridium sp.]|jgi:undecaprenyl diphosphate synthase|uniref:isoprenyl transferase n=1 Tax=uncultured Clostridium sp. TaxID=59620 RepID=UPI0026129566|nr:isoprenyl transferase [uncultured Clostridium sp.]
MINIFKGRKNGKEEEVAIDMDRIPKHIAIIMDGNGRWAKVRGLARTMGHRAGTETIRRVLRECDKLSVEYLTLYAFSTENWKRPKDEVNAIMKLLVEFLRKEIRGLNENNVKITTIGDLTKIPEFCQTEIEMAKNLTKNNTGVVLNVAFNYGGRDEIVRAIKKCLEDKSLNPKDLTEEKFEKYLDTNGMPDPEIIIRPSGEQRISNYLLWQCAYSEFWYSNINWPDFKEEDLREAIYDFQNRDRRFGGVKK